MVSFETVRPTPPSRVRRLRDGWRQASWSLTTRCDLACSYCRVPPASGQADGPTAGQVAAALRSHGHRWIVSLTGGEPLMHAGLEEICAELGRSFPLVIDSNLMNSQRVRALAAVLAPVEVEATVHATLHPGAVPWPEGGERFAENMTLLRESGVAVMAVAVLHPGEIGRFGQARELLSARGIRLLPKPFKGEHAGRSYPAAYNRAALATLLRARPFLRFYPFASHGLPCAAGSSFIRIEQDGAVQRCVGDRASLGDVRDGFELLPGPAPCAAAACPCFGHDLLAPGDLRQQVLARAERWSHHARRPALAFGSMLGAAVARRLARP